MKKIIFISPQVFIPPIDGGKRCICARVASFTEYKDIYVVMANSESCLDDKKISGMTLGNAKEILVFPRKSSRILKSSLRGKLREIIKWFFSGKPRAAQTIESKNHKEEVTNYIIKKNIGCVVLETIYAAELVDIDRIKKYGIKIFTIEHNVEFLFIKDTLSEYKIFKWIEVVRTKNYEQNILKKSDKIFSISPVDGEILKNQFKLDHIKYLPIFFEKKRENWKGKKSNYIIFSGSLSFYLNYHGIKWFIEEVFLEYIKKYSHMRLIITGRVEYKIKKELSFVENIFFTGFLLESELERYLLYSSFAVIPILKGSGIKIKLLEALSYGIPIITTKHVAEGIPFYDENPYLVGNNAKEFLEKMIFLSENEDECWKIGSKAKQFFDEVYASENNISKWIENLD